MRQLRYNVIGFILLAAMAASFFGVNRLGLELRRQAVESWLEKANSECQRITDTSLGWLSLFHAQLRGVASVFYGSETVTEKEFLDALDLIEGVELEAMIPLTSVAYAEQRSPGYPTDHNVSRDGVFPVVLSSDVSGPLAVGKNLAAHPEIRSAILSAMDQSEKVIMGPVFRAENNQMFISFAIKAMNGGKPGILVSVVNLSDFVTDLDILYIPDGLNLRIIEREGKPAGSGGTVIAGDRLPLAHTVATAYFPTQSGQAHWDYCWDVLSDYQGGPPTMLGAVVQYGGNALVLSVFLVVASLMLQNVRVNRLVDRRTEELVIATRAAEAANQAKSAFLANMSHELRTPLTVILGYSQMLQRTPTLQPEHRKHMETINTSSEQLLALINDVLEISRIEAKQVSLNVDSLDLHALIDDLEDMFRDRAKAKGLQFEIVGIENATRYVASDENKLRQVLINLLANAVKFTDQGGIYMRVGCGSPAENGQRVLRLEVEDTGVGIARDELDKVFRNFEQTESGRKSKSGTGLGMAISRDYARMMGGDITVESKVGKGSTFRFEIPVGEGSEPSITERGRQRRVTGLAPGQAAPRILVAEDVEDSRALLVRILDEVGFEVREAINGNQAVEVFQHWKPHFIWMDVRMPVMDGLQASRYIKETEAGKSTVIVALTAHALEEEREQILEAGCDDFVRKPFREQEIFEVMAGHLSLKYVYEEEPEEAEPLIVDEAKAVKMPSQAVLEQIIQHAERGEFTRLGRILDELETEDATYSGFCDRIRAYAKKYDDEGIIKYINR